MKTITVSTGTFARLWSLRKEGEESEEDILARILFQKTGPNPTITSKPPINLKENNYSQNVKQSRKKPRAPFEVSRFEVANFILRASKYDIEAYAIYSDEKWTVLAGSRAMADWIGNESNNSYIELHKELIDKNILIPVTDRYAEFTDNFTFSSPSAASAVILGRSDNGRNSWKHRETEDTFNDWIRR